MMGFKDDMAPHDEQWNTTEAATGGPTIFTDGNHQAVVTSCLIYDHPDFGWQWEIGVTGTDANTGQSASIRKWHNLPPNDEGYKYVKADAKALGHDGELSDLETFCQSEAALGITVDIFIKSKPSRDDPNRTFSNLYINRGYPKGGAPAAPGVRDDEDIPF